MKLENDIIYILKEQINGYKSLHEVLKKEKICLVNIDPDEVTEISKVKDTIVMRLRLLEEERVRLIKAYVGDNDIQGDVDLKELERLTGNTIFSSLRSQLLSLLQTIDDMNKFNSILIDRSINHIKTTSSFINSYSRENIKNTTGVLLSKET